MPTCPTTSNSQVYAWYEEGSTNEIVSTDDVSVVDKRESDKTYWAKCKHGVSGKYSNDNVIKWEGSGAKWVSSVATLFSRHSTASRKERKSRATCIKKQKLDGLKSKICVS